MNKNLKTENKKEPFLRNLNSLFYFLIHQLTSFQLEFTKKKEELFVP